MNKIFLCASLAFLIVFIVPLFKFVSVTTTMSLIFATYLFLSKKLDLYVFSFGPIDVSSSPLFNILFANSLFSLGYIFLKFVGSIAIVFHFLSYDVLCVLISNSSAKHHNIYYYTIQLIHIYIIN